MSRHNATAILQIANGATISGALSGYWGVNPAKVALDHAANITIKTPAALTGAVRVEVAQKKNPASGDFAPLKNDDGTDVTLTAGRSQIIDVPAASDLQLVSSLAEGALRDFIVTVQEDI